MVVGGSAVGPWALLQERAFVYGDGRIEDLTNMIHPASPLKPYVIGDSAA